MPQINNYDLEFHYLMVFFNVIIFIILLYGFCKFINDFSRELRFLNNEINRTRGTERKHWIRRKRKLWLSLIPFVKYR